jgi:hypothetical protein
MSQVIRVSEGSRLIQTDAHRVEVMEPWKAAEYDPALSVWLQLPVGDEPPCGCDEGWGTRNPIGYLKVRVCHGCRRSFRQEVDARLVAEVVGALTGEPKRLARS